MLLSVLIVIILAKIKKYKILPIFKVYDLYPFFAVEAVYIFFQVNLYFQNYTYVKYAFVLQKAILLVMFVPMIRRKLYKQALIGTGLIIVGSILNKIVIVANGNKMPVFPTLSELTGNCKAEVLSKGYDSVHILMDSTTKLNFLGDYIDVGYSILSIGDLFIHTFVAMMFYYTIKELNKNTICR